MKNKKRMNQKIQKKRNKRNTKTRKLMKSKSSFSFEHQIYGMDVDNAKEGWVSKEEPS